MTSGSEEEKLSKIKENEWFKSMSNQEKWTACKAELVAAGVWHVKGYGTKSKKEESEK